MTDAPEPYDSTADTELHITRVRYYLEAVRLNLHQRALVHDASKLVDPEKAAFDLLTPRLKGLTYGSDEYRASLREMKPAIEHHYAHNPHHPEFYKDGVDGMSLLDVVEMALADWPAAVERHATGDLLKSLEINRTRFGMSDQLVNLIRNTYVELGLAGAIRGE